MDLESLYQEIILDHYKHPRGRGLREPFGAEVHHVNPTCGDELTVRVAIEGDVVTDISYDGQGCSISQASASVMFEQLVGHPITADLAVADEFLALMQSRGNLEPNEDVLGDAIAFAGVAKYPARVKCALLGWMAWKDAVSQAVDRESPEVTR
ncbi:MAG: SUF system NifU family Fe-S cluster assembly protein [Actinomycetes bacterium]|jgi:nitrogen fixation NifU-like protein